jgi:hypothetical protein
MLDTPKYKKGKPRALSREAVKEEASKRFYVELPAELHKKIKNYCTDNGITMSLWLQERIKGIKE